MLNITRATTHILRVHRAKCRGHNFKRVHGPTKIPTAKHFESAE